MPAAVERSPEQPGKGVSPRRGRRLKSPGSKRSRAPVQASGAITAFEPRQGSLAERALAVPVSGRRGGSPVAWLVVISQQGRLGEFEQLTARQGAIVVGLELMRERVVRETERRLAGDILAEALSGRLDADELRGRLRPFGIGAEAAVVIFDLEDTDAGEGALEREPADAGIPALVTTTSAGGRPLLCAMIDGRAGDPVDVAGTLRSALLAAHGPVRVAASRRTPVGSLRRAFHEARCALEATSLGTATAPEVASYADLGAFTLLLRFRTTTRCGCTATACWSPSSGPRATTAASSCDRSRHSSSTTATGSARRASSTATATRFATASGSSRSSPAATSRARRTASSSGWPCGRGSSLRMRVAVLGAGGTIAPAIVRDLAESDEVEALAPARPRRGARPGCRRAPRRRQGPRRPASTRRRARRSPPRSRTRRPRQLRQLPGQPRRDGACLRAGSHYIDLGGLYWMTELQSSSTTSSGARACWRSWAWARPGQDEPDGADGGGLAGPRRPGREAEAAVRRHARPGADLDPPTGSASPTPSRPCSTS